MVLIAIKRTPAADRHIPRGRGRGRRLPPPERCRGECAQPARRAAGDAVLGRLAEVLQAHARSTDVVGRMGGGGFLILLPDVSGQEAVRLGERLRRVVQDTPMRTLPAPVTITISIGIATVRPDDRGAEQVLARADAALYRAKTGGRNRVEVEDAGVADTARRATAAPIRAAS